MFRRIGLPGRVGPQLQLSHTMDREDLPLKVLRTCASCKLLMPYGRLDPLHFHDLLTLVSGTVNHIYAYHLAQLMGWRSVLILEDDAILPDDFLARLRARIDGLPGTVARTRTPAFAASLKTAFASFVVAEGWAIYNFGCNPPRTRRARPLTPGSHVCARGYVLSPKGLEFFARRASIAKAGADWMVWRQGLTQCPAAHGIQCPGPTDLLAPCSSLRCGASRRSPRARS